MSSSPKSLLSDYAFLILKPLEKLYAAFTHGNNDFKSPERSREAVIKGAVKLLLDGMSYHRPDSDETRKASIANVLHSDFSMYEEDPAWFKSACLHAAMLAELGYQRHSYDTQLQIARFTWFILYMDDLSHKFPSSMERFQLLILSSENGDQALLNQFRANLCDMYPVWDPISANCIVSSAMDYINGCLLERLQTVSKMKICADAQSWPYYLREKTGVAAAYAFMIFPRNPSYSMIDFIQVIGDIMVYINLANDVLSNIGAFHRFYKEEMANETGNYVHNRALVHGQSANDTLEDVSRDALAAYFRVCGILKSHSLTAYNLWKTFAFGYM
ncbi:hypothetical protein E4T56_gene2214 [Termitomyces sp. T112]|nr:hypothetical protein E4T56_gene2214 [Termitomyces sp. T112]